MKRMAAIVALVSLAVPGLARAAQTMVVERTPEYWYSYASRLPIGATVRVRTADGARETAVLSQVDRDGITIELKTRIPEPARKIPFGQLVQLELKQNGASAVKAVAIGAGVGAGAFLGLLAILAASWD